MKKWKSKLTILFVAMFFTFAFVQTVNAAQADETFAGAVSIADEIKQRGSMAGSFVGDDISQYGSGNSLVKQIDATANSVTVQWSSNYSSYAEGYVVYVGQNVYQQVPNTVNQLTITGLQPGQVYTVIVGFVQGGEILPLDIYNSATSGTYVRTTPNKLASKYMQVTWKKDEKIIVEYVDESSFMPTDYSLEKYIDGIEFKVKDTKGKVRKTVKKAPKKTVYVSAADTPAVLAEKMIDSFTFGAPSAIKNKGMQYQVRTYIVLDNGKKVYSDWTSTKAFVPQAKVSKLVGRQGSDNVTVYWKKVSGAKGYTVYKTTNSGKSYKKVKSVGANTTSCTVSGFKRGKKYGVVIVANKVKVGKKRYNSEKSYYTYRNN